MQRQMLHGKIHGAVVTQARVDYVGSITIDEELLEFADIKEYEKVLIANLTNGARLESYAISGPRGSGVICLNGGAAKHGKPGDQLIVMTFSVLTEEEVASHQPKTIYVNEKNEVRT